MVAANPSRYDGQVVMNPMGVCWSCRGGIASGVGFCPTCQVIQPPDPRMNHFQYFGIDPGFVIDLAVLETSYQERQRRFHPDLFVSRGAAEKRYSMEHVTRLNEGYRILKDPLRRGEYLLFVTGLRTQTPENTTPTDPEFLLEVMELRESLADVDVKQADAVVRLQNLRNHVETLCVEGIAALATNFSEWFSFHRAKSLENAAEQTDRLRYFRRFLEELDRKEEMVYEKK